ncbi:MAG: hypothetical protein AAF901_14295, partial [Bacteroidota bacterium]
MKEQKNAISLFEWNSVLKIEEMEDRVKKSNTTIFGFDTPKKTAEEVAIIHNTMKRFKIHRDVQITFVHIYYNLLKLAKIVSCDCTWETINIDDDKEVQSLRDKVTLNKRIVYNWSDIMICVPQCYNGNDEEGNPSWEDMSVCNIENDIGHQWFIPLCVMTRVRQHNFFCNDESNLEAAIINHGYVHHRYLTVRTKSVSYDLFISEVKKCQPLIDKLYELCNREVGNRKRKLKMEYFNMLGYAIEKITIRSSSKRGKITKQKVYGRTSSTEARVGSGRTSSTKKNYGGDHDDGTMNRKQPESNITGIELLDESNSVLNSQETETSEEPEDDNCNIDKEQEKLLKKEIVQMVNETKRKLIKKDSAGNPITNWWRVAKYNDIRSNDESNDDNYNVESIDYLFNNEPARNAYRTFRGYTCHESEDTSIVILARIDAWMTTVIEDLERKKEGCKKGGSETMVLKKRFEYLLPIALENLLKEITNRVSTVLSESGEDAEKFSSELSVYDGTDLQEQLGNRNRKY